MRFFQSTKQKPSICSRAPGTPALVLNATCYGPADEDPEGQHAERMTGAGQRQQVPNLHLILCGWLSIHPSPPPQHTPPNLHSQVFIIWIGDFFLCYFSITDLWVWEGNLPLL